MKNKNQEIIDAARELLIEEGSAGFSMRKVAQKLGMSLGNVQYYFPSRVKVLEGLLETDLDAYRKGFAAIQQENHRGYETLNTSIDQMLGESGEQDEVAVFRALFSFHEPEIIESLKRYYQELYELLAQGLAHLSERPLDSPEVQQATALLFPYLDGYVTTAGFLSLNQKEISALLTKQIWNILGKNQESI
jgi:AcrR family transcriptional regulator